MKQDDCPFGKSAQKYWDRRYDYFSNWDDGIQTDEIGLYSVKPEKAAMETARLLKGDVVLDAFCGIGGSAIAFARCGKKVITADIDAGRLAMARHNAELCNVLDRIVFINDDVRTIAKKARYEAVYIDPPWGGPDYTKKESFEWSDFCPNPLDIIKHAIAITASIAVGLPVNFSRKALLELPQDLSIVKTVLGGKALFETAYYPAPPDLSALNQD